MSGSAMWLREHMEVVGTDGQRVEMVNHANGNRITLTTRDDPDGSGSTSMPSPCACRARSAAGAARGRDVAPR